MAKGILIAAIDFTGAAEDEFHDWCETEHIPERQRVPGFLACDRWIGAHNPKISLATYELENVDVLKTAAYRAIGMDNLSVWSKRMMARFKLLMRYEGEQILPGDQTAPKDAPALLLNAMSVAPEHENEFNEWYNTEHIPALTAVPGTLCARRYRAAAVPPNATSLFTTSRRRMYRIRWHGKKRPIHPGPSACGSVSATICASSAGAILVRVSNSPRKHGRSRYDLRHPRIYSAMDTGLRRCDEIAISVVSASFPCLGEEWY
jgi:hypothetical protein